MPISLNPRNNNQTDNNSRQTSKLSLYFKSIIPTIIGIVILTGIYWSWYKNNQQSAEENSVKGILNEIDLSNEEVNRLGRLVKQPQFLHNQKIEIIGLIRPGNGCGESNFVLDYNYTQGSGSISLFFGDIKDKIEKYSNKQVKIEGVFYINRSMAACSFSYIKVSRIQFFP